ncbi:cellulose synthase-like protein G3 [Morus notabilis]|uniref:cellulose synthase-like protein G3 n=1 Tax=Morus notabilis TaxID=981085 RepID=UPI000CED7038|nr:cellulose synthase-like protein G3 [Morus notabilis]
MEALLRSTGGSPPLHTAKISRLAISNRIFAAVYASAVLTLLYHHLETLADSTTSISSLLISLSLLIADLILAFMWTTTQSFRMHPVYRTESPESLAKVVTDQTDCVPAMDVFICTADPYKEPPMGVVNTALSVMAYDYPPEKLSLYVSDDGGSAPTLFAFLEAAKFAAHWLPFCRKNDVVERSPEVYFASNDCRFSEAQKIKTMYESMKVRVENVVERGKVGDEFITGEEESQAFNKWTDGFTRQDHPTVIQVILDKSKDRDITGHVMPNLIYVSREKSMTSHHHFKAGALNVLIRVSAIMMNSPIILTLDCDTYSNDPKTLQRVLCYFSDTKVESKVGYIQFPQKFHGINKNDIYGCEIKRLFVINPQGMDGLNGPNHVGTGCFFNRRVFFGGPSALLLPELPELSPYHVVNKPIQSPQVLKLAHRVAGCNYENQTQWGFKVGVRYGSLVEDYFTGYRVQCEGWKTIFCNPDRPAFYGEAPISLIDVLNQNKRWAIGLLEVAFSKYCPLTFGISLMGPLMGLAYAHYAFWPIWSIPAAIYAFVPQFTLLNGVTIFPKVSEPWFVLYLFLFFGAYGQDLLDFIVGGGTFQRWWGDQRMWMIRSLSCFLFGSIEYSMKSLGISTHGFNVTSKVLNEEQSKRYEQGVFEFGVHSPLFVPLTMAAITNLAALIFAIVTILRGGGGDFERLLMQLLIVAFAVVNCLPVYEAMIFRSNKGGIPIKTTLLATFLTLTLFAVAYVTLRN